MQEELLRKINRTSRNNLVPHSAFAILLECLPNNQSPHDRFYHEYLVSSANEKHSNGVLNAQYEDAVYKKSLPSLLFLSFGIFLLNSVNEIMTRRGVIATARMLVRERDLCLRSFMFKGEG